MFDLFRKMLNANEVIMDISNDAFYVRESFINLWRWDITSYPNGTQRLVIINELDDDEYSFNMDNVRSGHYDDNGAWIFEANGVTISFLCL